MPRLLVREIHHAFRRFWSDGECCRITRSCAHGGKVKTTGRMAEAAKRWCVYIVRCADGSLYTGVAIDLARRLAEHNGQGKRGARYTRVRRPVTLVYQVTAANRAAACKREYRIKQLSRREKLALIAAGSRAKSRARLARAASAKHATPPTHPRAQPRSNT